jgi:hypothetical protein
MMTVAHIHNLGTELQEKEVESQWRLMSFVVVHVAQRHSDVCELQFTSHPSNGC